MANWGFYSSLTYYSFMDTSSSRRRFLQTLGLATGALAAGSLANAQEVEALAPKKIIIPDPNNIGPMTTWPARKPGAQYMGGFRAPKLGKALSEAYAKLAAPALPAAKAD